ATVGLTGPSVWTWIAAWSAYALVVVLILPIVWGAAIASAFQVSRGLALGLGLSGSGIASVVYPPLTLWLLHTFGLRGVYPGLGAFILLTLGPLVVFAFRPPVARAVAKGATDVRAWGHTLPEAMRTGLLWRIVLVLAAAAIVSSAINVHLQPLLTDRGFSTVQAASIAAAIGPSVLFGRWVGGLLLDRLHARWIALAFYLLPALGCLLLVGSSGTYLRGLVSAVLIGLSVGVEGDLLPFLLSRYFGVRHFGAIYGLGMAVFGAGYAIGPLAAGALFDRSGSYDVFLMTIAATLAVAGLVTLSFGAYPSSPNAGPASAGVEQG
ncbi:MAG: transporter, partial [Phenylobacterium sp.]|nr:transporter [Phenylobacterium sp.]